MNGNPMGFSFEWGGFGWFLRESSTIQTSGPQNKSFIDGLHLCTSWMSMYVYVCVCVYVCVHAYMHVEARRLPQVSLSTVHLGFGG